MKILFSLLVIIAAIIQLTHSATLRRKPKVYNALITTDQNLTPSRAFPVIQPHLQETYAYPSYSYRSYAPLGLYNNGFSYGSAAGSIPSYNHFHSYPRINTGLVEARNFFSRDDVHNTIPPIRNDFGLPPSLVPINSFPFGNLAPYPYHSYPTAYDQFGGYGGYLPPYPFYPPGFDPELAKGDESGKDGADKTGSKSSGGSAGSTNGDGPSGAESAGANGGSGGNNSGSSGGSNGGSSGGNNSGSSGGSNGDSSGGSNDGSSGNSGSSGGGGSSSSSSTSTSSSTKSSRSRNFDKPEHPQQQSLIENITPRQG